MVVPQQGITTNTQKVYCNKAKTATKELNTSRESAAAADKNSTDNVDDILRRNAIDDYVYIWTNKFM